MLNWHCPLFRLIFQLQTQKPVPVICNSFYKSPTFSAELILLSESKSALPHSGRPVYIGRLKSQNEGSYSIRIWNSEATFQR